MLLSQIVHNFGLISKPLPNMMRKDNFKWTVHAYKAFKALKLALTTTSIFALPHFSKTFVVECDASNGEIGAILSQDRHPIAYLSKALSDKHRVCNFAIVMHMTLNQKVNMKSSIIPWNTTCDVLWERNKLLGSNGCLGRNGGTISLIILPFA